jgi:hypothetical protein
MGSTNAWGCTIVTRTPYILTEIHLTQSHSLESLLQFCIEIEITLPFRCARRVTLKLDDIS